MENLGKYEIVNYTIQHPKNGMLNKQKIIYYNNQNEIETVEYYFGYIKTGYTEKN